MIKDLQGKVALVTGAANDIGKAIAHKYAEAGAALVLADMDRALGEEVYRSLQETGAQVIFQAMDVRDQQAHEALVALAEDRFGRLDVACNNAGISGGVAPLVDYPLDVWKDVLDINLSGVFFGMRAQIPAMLKHNKGSIVNMASILGHVTYVAAPAYTAAKHGVVGLTKSAAFDYSRQGIRVNSIAPGFIETPLIKTVLKPEEHSAIAQRHLMGRMGTPDEVAELVLWLSSDRSSFATGASYALDGGYLAQ